jgi:rhodanese-related sulfurtransferase
MFYTFENPDFVEYESVGIIAARSQSQFDDRYHTSNDRAALMKTAIRSTMAAMALPTLAAVYPVAANADEPPCEFNENRRGICGNYHSEISPAEAFVDTVVKRGKWADPQEGPVILDVRSTPEYRVAHPENAYNVPYPFIYEYCEDVPGDDRRPDGACVEGDDDFDRIGQPPEDFVAYVEEIVPNKDTPIYTLCRTGVRSVGAAEVLTEAGYTHVRNIWEGFVGVYLTAPFQDPDQTDPTPGPVDLNHDGELTDEDKNGWWNHQALPYDTRLLRKLMYKGEFSESYGWE